MSGESGRCSRREAETIPRWLLELARFVGGVTAMRQEIGEIGTAADEVNEAVRVLGRAVATMQEEMSELGTSVDDLAKANRCLERASQQQALLGDRHYEEHVVGPLVNTVVSLINLMDECQPEESEKAESVVGRLREINHAVRSGLEQLLDVHGVELFRSKPTAEFNRRTMRMVQAEVTDEKNLGRRVSESLRCGVRRGERILRCESVAVYQYEQEATQPREVPGLREVA